MSREPASPSGRVLIVDDDRAILDTLREVLADTGYDVVTAASAGEALVELDDAHRLPDLMLVDLMMPGIDGWQLVGRIRQDDRLGVVPIVIMSAGGAPLLATAPLVEAYLPKPIRTTQLLQIVHRTLTLATIRRMSRSSGTRARANPYDLSGLDGVEDVDLPGRQRG
jgi:CheY-like chemotaxis protein